MTSLSAHRQHEPARFHPPRSRQPRCAPPSISPTVGRAAAPLATRRGARARPGSPTVYAPSMRRHAWSGPAGQPSGNSSTGSRGEPPPMRRGERRNHSKAPGETPPPLFSTPAHTPRHPTPRGAPFEEREAEVETSGRRWVGVGWGAWAPDAEHDAAAPGELHGAGEAAGGARDARPDEPRPQRVVGLDDLRPRPAPAARGGASRWGRRGCAAAARVRVPLRPSISIAGWNLKRIR